VIVKVEILFQPAIQLLSVFIHVQINAFVFDGFPKVFDEYVVQRTAFTIHTNGNFMPPEQPGVRLAGKLAALVRID
jgi:hypothetical protein